MFGGLIGAIVGTTGAGVGATGAGVGALVGAEVGSIGAALGTTGADVGGTGAGVMISTLASSQADTLRPESMQYPLTHASMGPSGALVPGQVGPSIYITDPGHSSSPEGMTIYGTPPLPTLIPLGEGSERITSVKQASVEFGTVIW
jgi:hypothetical protein